MAVGPIALVVGVKLVLQLVFLTGYGWHRDEFYYLIGGRHLDIGYVDHPLLAPWVARGVDLVFGPSLPALRVVPALLGAATVLLTALLAREFGGGRMAQTIAALCVALDPAFLAINHWFQTPSFDAFAWVALSYALVRVSARERPALVARRWAPPEQSACCQRRRSSSGWSRSESGWSRRPLGVGCGSRLLRSRSESSSSPGCRSCGSRCVTGGRSWSSPRT